MEAVGDFCCCADAPPALFACRLASVGDDCMLAMALAITEADRPGSLSLRFFGPLSSLSSSRFTADHTPVGATLLPDCCCSCV